MSGMQHEAHQAALYHEQIGRHGAEGMQAMPERRPGQGGRCRNLEGVGARRRMAGVSRLSNKRHPSKSPFLIQGDGLFILTG